MPELDAPPGLLRSHSTSNGEIIGIGLADVLASVRRRLRLVFAISLLGLIGGVVAAALIQPLYYAEVAIALSKNSKSGGGLSSLANQLGGLGALAGLTSAGNEGKEEALATLASHSLSAEFIDSRKLLPELLHTHWNKSARRLEPGLFGNIPTAWDANNYFSERVRSISEDRRSGIIRVGMSWRDPKLAAQWANDYVKLANSILRNRAIAESNRNLLYLNSQLDQSTVIELRAAVYRLIEAEVKNIMLAKGNEDYAFKVIDTAVAPERPSRPNRILLVLASLVGSFFLAALLVILRDLGMPPNKT